MAATYEEVHRRLVAADATLAIACAQGRTALREYVDTYAPLYTDRVSGKTIAEIIADPRCTLDVYDVVTMLGRCTEYYYDEDTNRYRYQPRRNDGKPDVPAAEQDLAMEVLHLVVPREPFAPDPPFISWRSFLRILGPTVGPSPPK